MSNPNLSNVTGKIKTAEIMHKLGKGIGNANADRQERLPPGQRLLHDREEFPVLDLGVIPEYNPETYKFEVLGLVDSPIQFSLEELKAKFQPVSLTADFHCVTKWSQYDINWTGIKFLDLEKLINPKASAKFLLQFGLDNYTTNVPIEDLRKENVILAYELKGKPLPPEHGWPLRLIIPGLYGWKGSKFLTQIQYLEQDRSGFWEVRGYNNHGDPWKEERYS